MKILNICMLLVACLTATAFAEKIAANNNIQVSIAGVPTSERSRISGTYQVTSKGYITLPLLDEVQIKAAGLTSPDLAKVIGDVYKKKGIFTSPVLTVTTFRDVEAERELINVKLKAEAERQRLKLKYEAEADERKRRLEAETKVVFVEGYANKPGRYTLTANMTIRALMAEFGNQNDFGSTQRIIHISKGKSTEYNYKDNPSVLNIRLAPGDFIKVPKGKGLLNK